MLRRKSTRSACAAPRSEGNAVRTHTGSSGGRNDAAFVRVADREYGVANDSNGRPGTGTYVLGERALGTQTAGHLIPSVAAVGESRTVMTAWAGIAASVVAVTLILVGPGHGPALAGALLLACVPVGAAVMCWVDCGDGFAQAGLTLVLSLAATAIASALMIWLATWHPSGLLAVFPAVSTVSCAVRLHVRRGTWNVAWSTPAVNRDLLLHLTLLFVGLGAWAYGVSQVRRQAIGSFGLLASANVWFYFGLATLLAGGLFELSRSVPRIWLLTTYLVALIVAIYAPVPILYGIPEYAWVYKHIGIAQTLGHYGHVTDSSNIYQQWPALFAAVASVSGLARIGPLSYAAWGPLTFELADALLLLGVFQLLGANRRVTFLALFLYEGLIAWVGQDYLSPQAFGYLLWLGIVTILIRWLLAPLAVHARRGMLARARAPFLVQLPVPYGSTRAQQALATTLIAIIYFAIVAAHQLTPYMAIAGVGALVLLGIVRRGWQILLMLATIAGGYLALHYNLIDQQFGGLFSGADVFQNASGVNVYHHGAEAITADIVRALAGCMWLLALVAIVHRRQALGPVSTIAGLAFSPFAIVFLQAYGGEAIYRVFLFSAPWCALLIAGLLVELRATLWQRLTVVSTCSFALAAGLQGLYGPVAAYSFTRAELAASLWLYGHAAPGSMFALADDNFPKLETANYNSYILRIIPAGPQLPETSLDNVNRVKAWIDSFGYQSVYVVFSSSMAANATYFDSPSDYAQLASAVKSTPEWSVVYRNADTTIYRVHV
jgi:hypothetical protein